MWGSSFMNKLVVWFANLYGDENDPPIQWVIFVVSVVTLVAWLMVGLGSPAKAEPARGDFRAMRSTPDISIAATATAEVLFFGPPASYIQIRNDCADDLYFDLNPPTGGVTPQAIYPLRLSGRGLTVSGAASLDTETFTFEGRVYSLGVSHGSASTASCTYTLILAR